MSVELKPCPFCGSKAQIVEGCGPFHGRVQIDCTKCRNATWWWDEAVAVRSWNSRTIVDQTLTDDQVEWVVNSLGELGVKIGQQFFFLYKGRSLVYKDAVHESDGTPMLWRMVGKREFGEVQHPQSWVTANRVEDRYTVNLVFHPGLSFGKPEDSDWKPLPAAPRETGDA
jgi:hypothetical protein